MPTFILLEEHIVWHLHFMPHIIEFQIIFHYYLFFEFFIREAFRWYSTSYMAFWIRKRSVHINQLNRDRSIPFELELYHLPRKGNNNFLSLNLPKNLISISLPDEEVLISRLCDVCAVIKPFDTWNKISPMSMLYILANFRPVNKFSVDRERLLWVQWADFFKLIFISQWTLTWFGNLMVKTTQSIL